MKVNIKQKNFYWDGKKAHFVLDTAWTLPELSLSDIAYYLDVRKSQKFNAVMFGPENRYLNNDFKWSQSYIQKLKDIMEMLQERRMWAVPGVSSVIYRNGKPDEFIPINVAEYVARKYTEIFNSYDNVWFHFVDVFDARKVGGTFIEPSVLRNYAKILATGIRKEDTQTLITMHPAHGYSSIDPSVGLPLSDIHNFIALQSGHTHGRDPNYVKQLYNNSWKKEPNALVFNMEPCYEGYDLVQLNDVKKIAQVDRELGPSITNGNFIVCVFQSGWRDALRATGTQYVLEEARKMGTPTPFEKIDSSSSSSSSLGSTNTIDVEIGRTALKAGFNNLRVKQQKILQLIDSIECHQQSQEQFMQNGNPVLYVLDTAWNLPTLSDTDIDFYLKKRKEQGFNGAMWEATNLVIDNSSTWTIKKSYLDRMNYIIDMFATKELWCPIGITCTLDWQKTFPFTPERIVPLNRARYVAKQIAEAIKDKQNVPFIYIRALDTGRDVGEDAVKAYARELGTGANEGDPNRLITLHPKHGFSSVDPIYGLPLDSFHNFASLHSGHTLGTTQQFVIELYQKTKEIVNNRIVFNMEPCYENYNNITPEQVRLIARVDSENGPSIVNGNLNVCLFNENWKDSLDDLGTQFMLIEAHKMGVPTLFKPFTSSSSSSYSSSSLSSSSGIPQEHSLEKSKQQINKGLKEIRDRVAIIEDVINNTTCD